jgi:ABC-type phosphate transport system auxiliary subunit
MSLLAKRQFKAYAAHRENRLAIRGRIDTAKMLGDAIAEKKARKELQKHWAKVPKMRTELLKQYGGNESKMNTDLEAYRLLNNI